MTTPDVTLSENLAPVGPASDDTALHIAVNGQETVVTPGTTVAALVAQWCASPDGIAVARNRDVVPRSAWASTALQSEDRVEIVTAAAGG
jgi:sulfur carrier protein